MSRMFNAIKHIFKGGKQKTTGTEVISSVNPNVPKTKIEKKIRDIKKNTQALKSSTKKLDQTTFEIVNKKFPITFKSNKGKTMSNTEKRNQGSQKLFEASKGRKELKFGGGADMGSKKLSPKQMKIAKLAGNKKKIDGPDFKKLRAMKSPMDKAVRKS